MAVANAAHDFASLKSLKGMDPHLLKELEHFFVSYNEMRGKKFELIAHRGPARAMKLLRDSVRVANAKKKER